MPTPAHNPLETPARGISRRTLLSLAGLAGAAVGIAGCAPKPGSPSPSANPSQSGSGANDPVIAALATWVQTKWPLGEQAWPGLDYTKHDLVVLSTDDQFQVKQAWLVNTTGARELAADEYSSISVPPTFDKLDFNGRQACVLSIPTLLMTLGDKLIDKPAGTDRDAENLFRVGSHELIHFYHQDPSVVAAGGNRNTVFPIDPEPRVMRRMLLRRLNEAAGADTGRDELLGKAAYWDQQWRTTYAQEAEAIHGYDILEGTANYFEYYLANVDPKASDPAASLKAGLDDASFYSAVDSESYALGYVTGLLLNQEKPGWQKDIYTTGKTLVQALLHDVAPMADEVEADVREGTTKLVTEANERAKPAIEAVDAALADPGIAYLTYTGNLTQLSYEESLSYKGRDVLKGPNLELNADGGSFTVRTPAVFSEPGQSYIVPLPKGSESFVDGKLTVTGEQVSGSAPAQLTEEGGRKIYTIKLMT